MTWVDRLVVLNLPNYSNITLVPVYFSGSKYIKQPILDELQKEYSWADVSQITYKRLIKSQTTRTRHQVLQYLLNHRGYSKIYKYSNVDILLMQMIQHNLRQIRKIENFKMNIGYLNGVYKQFFDFLQETSNSHIVVLIDCRIKYFEQYHHNFNEIILHTIALVALMSKRLLYSFIEFIIIMDEIKSVEEIRDNECFNYESMTKDKNHIVNNDFENLTSSILSASEIQNVAFLQRKVLENLHHSDKILKHLDKNLIKKIIINAHRSNNSLDLELS